MYLKNLFWLFGFGFYLAVPVPKHVQAAEKSRAEKSLEK